MKHMSPPVVSCDVVGLRFDDLIFMHVKDNSFAETLFFSNVLLAFNGLPLSIVYPLN